MASLSLESHKEFTTIADDVSEKVKGIKNNVPSLLAKVFNNEVVVDHSKLDTAKIDINNLDVTNPDDVAKFFFD